MIKDTSNITEEKAKEVLKDLFRYFGTKQSTIAEWKECGTLTAWTKHMTICPVFAIEEAAQRYKADSKDRFFSFKGYMSVVDDVWDSHNAREYEREKEREYHETMKFWSGKNFKKDKEFSKKALALLRKITMSSYKTPYLKTDEGRREYIALFGKFPR